MARRAYRRRLNGAPRRAAKRQRSKNSRWMHLVAGAVGTRQLLQRCWARHTTAVTSSLFQTAYAQIIRLILANQQINAQPIQTCINFLVQQTAVYVHHVQQWQTTDCLLYDIPLTEWLQSREYCPRRYLWIGAIDNNMMAMKIT